MRPSSASSEGRGRTRSFSLPVTPRRPPPCPPPEPALGRVQPSRLNVSPNSRSEEWMSVCSRERSRLSPEDEFQHFYPVQTPAVSACHRRVRLRTAALGLPFRNNNAQAKFGGPGGNDNANTDNILWILVALELQVAARPCAARRCDRASAERKAKTRYKERTWSTRSDCWRLTALRRRMWRRSLGRIGIMPRLALGRWRMDHGASSRPTGRQPKPRFEAWLCWSRNLPSGRCPAAGTGMRKGLGRLRIRLAPASHRSILAGR